MTVIPPVRRLSTLLPLVHLAADGISDHANTVNISEKPAGIIHQRQSIRIFTDLASEC